MRPETPDPSSAPVERCPHRTRAREDGDIEKARCGVLAEFSGVQEESLLEVRRDACEVCFKLPERHEDRINNVHASLLYTLAERVIERQGVAGCDLGKAVGIRAWAEMNLRFDDGVAPTDFDQLDRIGVASECLHFGEEIGTKELAGLRTPRKVAVHHCRHAGRDRTTVSECFRCRDWTEDPDEDRQPLVETFRSPPQRSGPEVKRWAVGVTTTRRFRPTLSYCLDSLIRAGWEEPRIFADSEVDIAERHRCLPLSLREPRLGAWPNYYVSLLELLMREPGADAYLLLQDDALLYDRENLREFLQDEVLWPGPDSADLGAVSLYCSREYTRPEPGWYPLGRTWVWGALAFIFPRESAKHFVSDSKVLAHRWIGRNNGCANIDAVVGEWATRHRLRIVFPTPSLAQHIGESSTLWPKASLRGSRRANRFAGERSTGVSD